jgi:hypothetical protein
MNDLFNYLKSNLPSNYTIEKEGEKIKVQRFGDTSSFFCIFKDRDSSKFGMHIISGTVSKPSKAIGGIWYNYLDQYFNKERVLSIVK